MLVKAGVGQIVIAGAVTYYPYLYTYLFLNHQSQNFVVNVKTGQHDCVHKIPVVLPLVVPPMLFDEPNHAADVDICKLTILHLWKINQIAEASMIWPFADACKSRSRVNCDCWSGDWLPYLYFHHFLNHQSLDFIVKVRMGFMIELIKHHFSCLSNMMYYIDFYSIKYCDKGWKKWVNDLKTFLK